MEVNDSPRHLTRRTCSTAALARILIFSIVILETTRLARQATRIHTWDSQLKDHPLRPHFSFYTLLVPTTLESLERNSTLTEEQEMSRLDIHLALLTTGTFPTLRLSWVPIFAQTSQSFRQKRRLLLRGD